VPNLTNSTVSVLKATHVPLKTPPPKEGVQVAGNATLKSSYVRQLALQSGEVTAVQEAGTGATADQNFWSLLRQYEGAPLASQLPSPAAFANVQVSDLAVFGRGLIAVRQRQLQQLQKNPAPAAPAGAVVKAALVAVPDSAAVSSAVNNLNSAVVANNAFVSDSSTSPIGMLNLERLEMTPAGVERGGLLATIPLAPKERTAVEQKEWSVTTQEFTSIVTDSLEDYSETGVTENTQLSQSTSSQVSHSNQFNINATVSGSYGGFLSASVATSFGTQDQNSQSATDSRNHSLQTTRQASSRVKQSHKMTISTTTVTGSSESTTRMLENPSATDPIRIDYFSLMRKWYVALYRYGLRLTYDITVPEPGAAMREIYENLSKLQAQAAQGFTFNLQYSDITPANLPNLVDTYGAQLPPPPAPGPTLTPNGQVTGLDDSENWHFFQLSFTVPDGYWITDVRAQAQVGIGDNYGAHALGIPGTPYYDHSPNANYNLDLTAMYGYMLNYTGTQTVTFFFQWANVAWVGLVVTTAPTPAAMQQWQTAVWNACYNAAQTSFYTQQQSISAQIATLQTQINSVDTLTLRREENDEIMKSVLRWLLGPGFEFMPDSVINLFKASGGDLQYGVNFTGNQISPSSLNWNLMYQNEDRISFINEAIDWDNVTYFLYSYFWDVPPSWDFIRQIQHPDPIRQAFLRAGSARVLLTVRPGWEVAWTYFVEYGSTTLPNPLPPHPYLTIAQQIAQYDNTNYPGIPSANPDGGGPIDDDTPQIGTTCNVALAVSNAPVSIEIADSTGFVTGNTAIIDTWDSNVQETQTITGVPDGTHIVVQALGYAHNPAAGQPFPVVQASAKGLLIGEWFEYTPTSGVDIAVTSNLATIA
jgi:hypothetical protein